MTKGHKHSIRIRLVSATDIQVSLRSRIVQNIWSHYAFQGYAKLADLLEYKGWVMA